MRFAGNRGCGQAIGLQARKRGIPVAAVAAVLALAASAPVQAAGVSQADPVTVTTAGQAVGSGLAKVAVLDVVMLVDESGSETAAKVADEKKTAGTIAQSMLNPASRVTVIGFGGVNNVAPNQSPADVVCQPTIASGAAHLSYLASCVSKLHRRTEAEGDDTDYAAALGQAMSYFNPSNTYGQQSPPGAVKVVLMMTDGAVDVHRDTQRYGSNWKLGEQQAINQQLSAARTYGAQVWPLGFGTDIGTGITEPQALAYLNSIAAHGAPALCGKSRSAGQPHATWVNNPDNAISALGQLYKDAGCLGSNGSKGDLGGGQTRTLTVTIPSIASSAAISVDRGSPSVRVSFTMPDGKQWTNSAAISGQDNNSPVEVLHLPNITGSEVGTWQVQLTAPPNLTRQLVSATVFWQGAVRATINANPPNAKLGQPISVIFSVLGVKGPITNPATLKNLLVRVTVSGDGLSGPIQVPVSNTGESGRSPTGAGDFKATYKAPSTQGTLTFTGTAAGNGLYATQQVTSVAVGPQIPQFNAGVVLPIVTSVQAGDSITGHVVFTNKSGTARQVRLQLVKTTGTNAAISPSGPITVQSGNPPSVPFTISFPKDTPAGSARLAVRVVSATNPNVSYSYETTTVQVTQPPGFLAKYLWYIIGIIVLIALIIAAVLWRRRVIRARKDVRGLVATLRRNGEQLGTELKAPDRWADVFRFIIRDEAEPTIRLDYPQPGIPEYQARRSGSGEVKLTTPVGGEPYDIVVGGPGEVMDHNGLELAFRDTRSLRGNWGGGRGTSRRTPTRRPTPSPSSQPPAPQPPAPQPPSPAPQPYGENGSSTIPSGSPGQKDEWL